MGRVAGAAAGKAWRDAIRLAANRETKDENGKKIRRINAMADKLVQLAIEGDVSAMKEVGDRLDGKATQIVGTDSENPLRAELKVIFERASAGSDG